MNPAATVQARRLREANLVRVARESVDAAWEAEKERRRARRSLRWHRFLLGLAVVGGGALAVAR